jgi:iron(III) transport system substrate-binding protein
MRHFFFLWILVALTVCSCQRASEVVVYCALDQVYSEPILRDFEQQTGIRVKPRFDLEATKTTGLVNLLLSEKDRPRCDVFWNNEMLQTVVLQNSGVLENYVSPSAATIPAEYRDPEGAWTGFAARIRVILAHKPSVGSERPDSLADLGHPRWKGRAAMARPLFGTTLTHMVCLRQSQGPQALDSLLESLQANQVQILDGNSVVKDQVARGEVAWGYTDSDDANVAVLSGAPVEMILPDQDGPGTLLIPNTVALIRGGPNPEAARKLVDYLLSVEVEEKLARSDSLQIPLHPEARATEATPRLDGLRVMPVDPSAAAMEFAPVMGMLRERFVR